MGDATQEKDFEAVKARLDEIVQAVSDENLPLDDALELYEEAVSLGLRVSDLLEDGVEVSDDDSAAPSEGDNPDVASQTESPAATPDENTAQ